MSTYTAEIGVRALQPEAAVSATEPADLHDVERFRAAMTGDESPGIAGEERDPGDDSAGAAIAPAGDETRRFVAVPFERLPPQRGAPAPRPVSATRRARLQTHAARSQAMRPLFDLLVGVHGRAAGRPVREMKIVPPQPNPLHLTLHLSMHDGEFVVAARTGLGPEQREEVHQALHLLQTALAARLRVPARVVLLA